MGLTDRALAGDGVPETEDTAPLTDRIQSAISSGVEFVSNIPSAVKKAYTGEDVEISFPDLPEITDMPASDTEGMSFLDRLIPNLQVIMTRDDLGKAEVIAETFKDDPAFNGVFQDEFGHPIVGYKDKFYYINKPGATAMDVKNLVGEAFKFAGATRYANKQPGLLPKVVKGAPAYTATDFAVQKAEDAMNPKTAEARGESLQTDIKQAATTGALATAADVVLPPVMGLAAKAITLPIRTAARGVATIKYPTLTRDTINRVVSGPQQVSKYPLTTGQAEFRGNPGTDVRATSQLREEDLARNAASADPAAQAIIRDFDQSQLDEIIADANSLIDEFGTPNTQIRNAARPEVAVTENITETLFDPRTGVARRLEGPAKEGYKAVDQGVPVTRDINGTQVQVGVIPPPTVTGENIAGILTRSIERAMAKFPAMKEADLLDPALSKIIANFGKTSDTALADGFGPKQIQFLRNKQALINGVIKDLSPEKTQTALFLGEIKKNLDQDLYTGIRRGLIDGDPVVLNLLKKSNQLYRDFMNMSGKGPAKNQTQRAGNAILKDMYEGDKSASDIAGMLFGHNKLAPKGSIKVVLDRLQSSIPETQFNSVLRDLKTAILVRAFSGKNTVMGDSSITRAAIVKNYNDAFETNTEIVKRIFSANELSKIKEFRDNVVPTMWADKRLIQNPSASGYTMMGALARVGLLPAAVRLGVALPVLGESVKELGSQSSAAFARDAVAQSIRIANTPLLSNLAAATERVSPDDEQLPVDSEALDGLLQTIDPEARQKILQSIGAQ